MGTATANGNGNGNVGGNGNKGALIADAAPANCPPVTCSHLEMHSQQSLLQGHYSTERLKSNLNS